MGIYAIAQIEFAADFAKQPDESVRQAFMEAKTFLAYQRQFNNLSIQEGGLRRLRKKDTATLQKMQQVRGRRWENERLAQAADLYIEAVQEDQLDDFHPALLGFEFQSRKSSAKPSISDRICADVAPQNESV